MYASLNEIELTVIGIITIYFLVYLAITLNL
jgi:hypothetical protein